MMSRYSTRQGNVPLVRRLRDRPFRRPKNRELYSAVIELARINKQLRRGSNVSSFQKALSKYERELVRLKKIALKNTLTPEMNMTLRSNVYTLASKLQTFAIARNDLSDLDPLDLQSLHQSIRKIQGEFRTMADLAPHKVPSEPLEITPLALDLSKPA